MVLVVEDDIATIQVSNELPDGKGDKFCIFVETSRTVEELYHIIASRSDFHVDLQTSALLHVNGSGSEQEFELNRGGKMTLKESGFLLEPEQNLVKIVPIKNSTAPSIVISLADKLDKSDDLDKSDKSLESADKPARLRRRNRMGDPGACDPAADTRFIKRNQEILHSSDSSPYSWDLCDIGYVGLVNQAATCYLNSLLQALYMTPEFRNALYKWEFTGSPEEMKKSIPYQLQKLFLSLQTSKRSAIETSKLTKSFGWDASDSWQQHDIQELCRVMFDALEQKFKDTDQADFINSLYQGKLIDYVTCLECRKEKTRIDTFLDIPLPVRPFGSSVSYNSVAEAMQAFIQPETLDGNNQYLCETCNKKCDAHKGLKFLHFPYILTLHLKRFDFDYNVMSRIKLTDRVEFPQTLNINSFLCEEAEAHVKADAKSSSIKETSQALQESNGLVSNRETNGDAKGDDASITDSVLTLEDEGCQGTEPSDVLENMHGSTSGSNSSESNADIQDDDEGIDVSNSTSNQQLQGSERNQQSGEGVPGPYIYELFAIMIHSGSASGGHYYVYIKDFDKGEWFCFDDQSVTKITNDDISMTYGGGSARGYYSGAHSSSTNAYMLMYRQIDKKRNQSVMTVDEFPPHMKELMKCMQEEEEQERIFRERDKERLRVKVYCRIPGDEQRLEKKMIIDRDTTLWDATSLAHQLFFLDGLYPLEQCRLVSYDSSSNTIECSFDDQDSETMSYLCSIIQNPQAQSLFLEIREKDAQFETYRPGGFGIKVYQVHVDTEEVDPPVEVRVQSLTTTFHEIRPQIAKALKLPVDVKLMMEKYGGSPIALEDEMTLQSAGFFSNNKVFVSSPSSSESDYFDKMSKIIDRFGNTITLYCTLPDTDGESLAKLGIAPLIGAEVTKVPNGEFESVSESSFAPPILAKSTSRGTSPQLPLLDGEEECLGTAGCSDQSTSEDSSLTDSDRTIVGGEADYWPREHPPVRNGHLDSDQPNLSSPEESDSSPVLKVKRKEKAIAANRVGDCAPEDKALDSEGFYLKIYPCKADLKKIIRIQVDKRMTMGTLKGALAQYMGISSDFVKLLRKCGSTELPFFPLQDQLSSLRDEEHIIVRLERALRKGEFRGKVYELLADDEPIKYLCDSILTKEMRVGDAKKQILEDLKKKDETEIPFNRCRLRFKKWKSPGKILLDSQSFQDLQLTANWELFLQKLSEPENVTSPQQVTVMLRRFYASDSSLDDFHEITLESSSVPELIEAISDFSGISVASLEFARPSGTFPFLPQNNTQTLSQLVWSSECNCNLEDGIVLYYRDKDDDSTENINRNSMDSKRRRVLLPNVEVSVASNKKKEKALKIIVSPSSSTTKETPVASE